MTKRKLKYSLPKRERHVTTKYTFKQEYTGFSGLSYSSPPSTVTMEINGDLNLAQLLERFEDFLKGSGFGFEGHLDFVVDEPDPVQHSGFYFDEDRNK